jgi:hypothetical protein
MNNFFAPIKKTKPFDHWVFKETLAKNIINDLCNLKLHKPSIMKNIGTRESNNESRIFLNNQTSNSYLVFQSVVDIFQNKKNISKLSKITKQNLHEGDLRIEYTIDSGNFWLTKHTDIDEKMITLVIYLNNSSLNQDWGTSLYNNDYSFYGNCPHGENIGMLFVPNKTSIHGFEKKLIIGQRKSLIINYVKNWKSTQELAPI